VRRGTPFAQTPSLARTRFVLARGGVPVTRLIVFLVSAVLVAAHLTGNMRALTTWFDLEPSHLLFILVLPLVFVMVIVLLRDDAR
jgi:uncharacterized membrane protein YhdT